MKLKKVLMVLSLMLTASMAVSCGGAANSSSVSKEKSDLTSSIVTTYDATDMSKNPETAKNRKDTLIIGTEAPDGVLNPLYAESLNDDYITDSMYEYLMTNTENGEVEDNLLESHGLSDDGLTYTFKLKKDLTWSDGNKITSKDIAFPIKVVCDGTYTGPLDFVTGKTKIKGGRDYKEGKAEDISGIQIVDDETIKITLEEKSSSAIYDLGVFRPIPESYYGKYYRHGNTDGLKETYKKPGPVSGAYKLTSYKEGQEIDLEANSKYHKGTPKTKNLIYKITEEDVQIPMLQSGDVDIVSPTVSEDNVETIEGLGYMSYKLFPTNGYGYIAFNEAKPIFKDKAVRQALATGLDRAKIVNSVYGKYASVINVPQSKASWAYADGDKDYAFDMDKAKKMLDDAGWKVGSDGIREKNGQKLEINFTGTTPNSVVDALLSVATDNWKELGIKFTSEKMDFNSMTAKQKTGNWDMLFMAWVLTADPNDSPIYGTNGSQNKTAYSNSKVDEIYKKIAAESDKDKQKELFKELYKELNEDLPYIYMYQRNDMWAYNGRVKGLEVSPYVRYTYNLYKVSVED
ncbi:MULTISPECIES: ABC transporter substrate-binding protein [Clostridium]|uniref:Solute-binding protein family 5 domain-containing protein n=1 Tax=Clostridium cibarium TaxID=2762247 RepID=A0ABR8PWK3_9CLOT|nr:MULTISPECIES: ABC transporter substrate-binding protein [Clostridium]MBD7912541.1 hypothetical protein [Clostridium cibarium]